MYLQNLRSSHIKNILLTMVSVVLIKTEITMQIRITQSHIATERLRANYSPSIFF